MKPSAASTRSTREGSPPSSPSRAESRSPSMRALVTGATGFIGPKIVKLLDRPSILSRDPQRAARTLGGVRAFRWEPAESPPDAGAFEGVDTVFHLARESIAG